MQPEIETAFTVVVRQCGKYFERCAERVLRVVLGRTRSAEHRHDLVADELVDHAAIAFDHGNQAIEKTVDDLERRLGTEAL